MTDTALLNSITTSGRLKFIDLKLKKVYFARITYGMPVTKRTLKRRWKTASQADDYGKRFAARCHRLSTAAAQVPA